MTDLDLDALAALYANEPESGTVWLDKATLLALLDRIESLEARLVRVTDDSMAERIQDVLHEFWSGNDDSSPNEAAVVLDAIRAVAADEQEAGR